LFRARHRKGHGIHSPFLFRLITEVMENKGHFSVYPVLKDAAVNVRNMIRILDVESYRRMNPDTTDHLLKATRQLHLLPERFDRLLFRLVNDFQPRTIAFFGSTFGPTLLALALADKRISVVAQVENDHYRSFCRRLVEVYEVPNIRITGTGAFTTCDFAVLQDPADPEHCHAILSQILSDPDFHGVVILCGIHTSQEMEHLWAKHKSNPVVRVALDIFEIGIFICREGLQKEEFVLRF